MKRNQPSTRAIRLNGVLLVLMGLLLSVGPITAVHARQPGHSVAYYLQLYGQIQPKQDPQVATAFRIFEQVRAVADKNSKRLPKLVVIASEADPWAISLPDGHIVLSRQAIKICYQHVVESEACLAFILGHELAHLANDDFWHQEVYGFLATHPDAQHITHLLKQRIAALETELEADDKGFIYAAMAGFQVAELIHPANQQTDFFTLWTQQTHTRNVAQTSMKSRSDFLKKRLKLVNEKHTFFEFGVRLSHFGYCDDGVYFFQEFLTAFPGREVFNNLGYCYLQLAIREMDPGRAWFYWMPLLLDATTRSSVLLRKTASFTSLKQAAVGQPTELLNQAIGYLQQAVEADPAYLPARLNLAAAYLYLGKPHKARIPVLEAKALAPDNRSIAELEALILYEQSDTELDFWRHAVTKLDALVQTPAISITYNRARLRTIRPQQATDALLWNQLAKKRSELPSPIRAIVCAQQKQMDIAACVERPLKSARPVPWKWPLTIQALQPINTEQQRMLQNWQKTAFDWFQTDLYGHIYQNPHTQAQLLEVDGFAQMQVLKGKQLGDLQALDGYCASPLTTRKLIRGQILSCQQWAVWVLDDEIQEVWQMAP